METNRILITGGEGLIGHSIMMKCLREGHDITVVDNQSLQSYTGIEVSRYSLPDGVDFIRADTESEKMLYKFEGERFDYIFNFGSYSSDRFFHIDQVDAVNRTIDGMLNIFKIANQTGARKIVYPSSGTVYGNTAPPQNEGQVLSPQTLYSITKIYLEMYSKISPEIESTAMRIFTGFGGREVLKGPVGSVVTLFTLNAIYGKPIEVYGNGEQKRDFVYVNDIAEVAYRTARTENLPPVLNVGSGTSKSFNDLIELISSHLDCEVMPNYVTSKTKFVSETRADASQLKKSIKFVPRSIDETFSDYLNELRAYIN